jgi:hypothetical protein
MKTPNPRLMFAVCVNNRGYRASLEVGKLYRIVPDSDATKHGYICVVDESGEEYAYAARRFFKIEIPATLRRALRVGRSAAAPERSLRG